MKKFKRSAQILLVLWFLGTAFCLAILFMAFDLGGITIFGID